MRRIPPKLLINPLKRMKELKILCPYCDAVWDAKMKADFDYSMGSEWTGMYGEEVSIEIYCSNCRKLVYKKNDSPYSFEDPNFKYKDAQNSA